MIVHRLDSSFVELINNKGMSVTLCKRGASLYDIVYHGDHMMAANALRDEFIKDRSAYYGRIVGPWAGRIKNSTYHVDGKEYHLDPNEEPNCVHSGGLCFGFYDFDVKLFNDKNATRVVFKKLFSASEQYPATAHVKCTYTFYENQNRLRIETDVLLDGHAPLRVLHHNYYNVGGEPTVLEQELFLDADEVATYEGRMIPTGYRKVDEVHDFRKPKKIAQDILDSSICEDPFLGYDHAYRLNEGEEGRVIASLENRKYRLLFRGDYKSVQVYSDNYPRPHNILSNGNVELKHGAIAIEFTDANGNCEEEIYGTEERPEYHRYFEIELQEK